MVNLDTIDLFISDNNVLKKYTDRKLVSEYQNGQKTKSYSKDKIYNFEYNQLGQLIKTKIYDYQTHFLGTVSFVYKDGLPFRDISKDSKGKTLYKDKYRYKRNKKNGI